MKYFQILTGMKNVVECYKEFFGYFNALETNGGSRSNQNKLLKEIGLYISTSKHTDYFICCTAK